MEGLTKRRIEEKLKHEQQVLFAQCWQMLLKEKAELSRNFHIARSLACSENNDGVSFDPKRLDLLRKNIDREEELLSRKKYFLIKAFEHIIDYCPDQLCVEYWDEELQKENPNLESRFADKGS